MGFDGSHNAAPYMKYIEKQAPGDERKGPWIKLFIEVVQNFKDGNSTLISAYIDSLQTTNQHFYFDAVVHLTTEDHDLRYAQISDTLYRMFGLWTLLENYFEPHSAAFAYIKQVGEKGNCETLGSLVKASNLLPSPREAEPFQSLVSARQVHASLESQSIDQTRLNAFRLRAYANTKIHWTTNISRHMILSQRAGCHYLELFALPCALENRSKEGLGTIGLSSTLVYEIRDSYTYLFNSPKPSFLHQVVFRSMGARWWCLCLSCSSRRLLAREIRDGMSEILDKKSLPASKDFEHQSDLPWSQSKYRNLWPRIIKLDAHLQKARPWGFWILFRDRRDTVQFWTFLFGSVILILTFIQVALGVAQVVGAF
ncbi:hypothetical protein P280DRAFT_468650 [Massarina eburnea CBS 473.64]|uniref:Uncharacterized protein n=1 Tax=Massarina eburnea CBS 473.64 TaxID=1395130 RepID=A0A6A6S2W4_9PLEO|nr:hypothetical protein P280DRAFT_468650 [Massarina eburnea CBS 473.64]